MNPPNPSALNPKLGKTAAVAEWLRQRLHWQVYAPGQKVPSVRALAARLHVSTFTVVQAYEQLAAQGMLTAVAGSGFYVQPPHHTAAAPATRQPLYQNVLETGWLMSHLFADLPADRSPGSGLLPDSWLQQDHLAAQVRPVLRELNGFAYAYGQVQGYLPLRQHWARQIGQWGIEAAADNIVTMPGIAAAISTLCQYLLRPGDTVLVDDPCWFWLIACLQQQGLHVVGVARNADGPDVAQMRTVLQSHRVRLYITNSVLHNPTSYMLHPARAHQVLNLLREFDAYLLEDDVYGAFAPDAASVRYATLDQMQRVFYVGGVSKILGGSWRVALLCCPPEHTENILRQKMLTQMACPEINERMVYRLWQSGHYRKHLQQLRTRLLQAHHRIRQHLPGIGLAYPPHTHPGLFIWLDTGVDTTELALAASQAQWLLAPGHLFSPQRQSSTHTRINVSRCPDAFLSWLGDHIRRQTSA